MSAFPTCIQHCPRDPTSCTNSRDRNKDPLNWKGRSKTVFICRPMIVCIENPKESFKERLLELLSDFSKVRGLQGQYAKINYFSLAKTTREHNLTK